MKFNGETADSRLGLTLSEDKRRLLERRLRRVSGGMTLGGGGIAPRPEGAKALASPSQARIWVLSDIDDNSASHNVVSSHEIQGSVNRVALEFALNAVVARHEILRSAYRLEEGEIVQVIAPRLELRVRQEQCASSREVLERAESFARERFDLGRGPLLRLGLFVSGSGRSVLILVVHDMIFDKWSQIIFWREFSAFYRQATSEMIAELPALSVQYSDYAYWQRDYLESDERERQSAFWKRALENPPSPIPLPTDWPYPPETGDAGGLIHSRLSVSVTRELRKLSAEQKSSLYSALITGFAILLSRYSGADDVLVSSPVANRRKQETADLIGLFLNTLIIRSDFSDNPTCLEALGRTSRRVLEALDHQDLPTDRIVEVVKPERVPGRHPLFQTMFIFQNEDERWARPELGSCAVTPIYVETKTARFDLSLFVAECGGALDTILEYRADLFRADTARRFLDHYAILIEQIVANPEARISELALLTAEERQFCARHEKGPELRIPGDVTVVDLMGRHASDTSMAIVSSRQCVTYRQLHQLSDRVAARLKERGAGANRPIAIAMERSPDAIVAMLGILKAGAPYLAIDVAYPEARIREVLDDASVGLVIRSRASEAWNGLDAVETLCLEEAMEGGPQPGPAGKPGVSQEQLAYLIYTSGTSGRPKGVPVTHRNLLASTLSRLDYYAAGPGSFLLLSSLSFDSSVAGIFWTLCTGGRLIVPAAEEARDPDAVCALVARHRIRALLAVPSIYEELLEWQPEQLDTLRVAIVAGEPCPVRLIRKHLRALPKCELYNEYGPTEATVWASVHRCDQRDDLTRDVSIGKPIPGCEIRILDSRRRRVPMGFIGELCIGGPGLTGGYLNRDELTATRFFTADDGAPMYATGDLARWLPDGRLEYHGRNDEQLKIRGYRIEVSEIETCLREMPGVRDAVVLGTSTHSAEASGAPDLDELLSVLPEETVKRALAELADETIAGNGSEAATVHRKADRGDFEVSFTLKRPGFIDPPRKAQRDWLLGQAMNEVTADLEHLDAVARRFVPGKDHKLEHDLADLTDASLSDDQIMEEWQRPIMEAMARYATESGGDVLEVGFGRGVSATLLQERGPSSHTIVEMNRHSIERHFVPWRQGYRDADIRLCAGRWQDVLPKLGLFDGILFHTYPMNEEEFVRYILSSVTFAEHAFEAMSRHLKPGGVFTYLTAEIDSLSRRHQRALLRYFSELTFKVIPVTVPPDTIDSWWADSMVAVKAVK